MVTVTGMMTVSVPAGKVAVIVTFWVNEVVVLMTSFLELRSLVL